MPELTLEEEAKKREEERIAAVYEEINRLQGIVSKCSSIEAELSSIRTQLSALNTNWDSVYATAMTYEEISDVVITDKFEGVVAETLKAEIPEYIALMKGNTVKLSQLMEGISSQLTKLRFYMNDLGRQIAALYASI